VQRFNQICERNVLTWCSKILECAPISDGVLAQLVEHHNGIVGVKGSNPLGSTITSTVKLWLQVEQVHFELVYRFYINFIFAIVGKFTASPRDRIAG
jgi:hypothetical protein